MVNEMEATFSQDSHGSTAVTTLPPCLAPLRLFTGSSEFLTRLHEAVLKTGADRSLGRPRLTVLTGLGGIGKSSMARKYAELYKDDHGGNIAWLNARTDESIVDCFVHLARHFQICLEIINGPKLQEEIDFVVQKVYEHFSKHIKRGLFIIDNAHKLRPGTALSGILNFLPKNTLENYPHFLITSRNKIWGPDVEIVRLKKWSQELSTEFLFKAFHVDMNYCKRNLAEHVVALGKLLDGYPLGLNLAVGTITSGLDYKVVDPYQFEDALCKEIGEYIIHFETNEEKWINEKFRSDSDDPCDLIMATVWESSEKSIRSHANAQRGDLAIKLLYIMSFLPNEFITVELLHLIENDVTLNDKNSFEYSSAQDVKGVEAALRLLEKFSMISIKELQRPSHHIWIHCLVQKWAREKCKREGQVPQILEQMKSFFQKNTLFLDKKLVTIYNRYYNMYSILHATAASESEYEQGTTQWLLTLNPDSEPTASFQYGDDNDGDYGDETVRYLNCVDQPEARRKKILILMEYAEAKRDIEKKIATAKADVIRAKATVDEGKADLKSLAENLRLQLELADIDYFSEDDNLVSPTNGFCTETADSRNLNRNT